MTHTTEQIESQMTVFIAALQEHINTCFAMHFPNVTVPKVEFEKGKKFYRVVRSESNADGEVYSRSAHCFVEISTGNILKCDGWKRPAKGIRGNIFDHNCGVGKAVGAYGAAHLR